jgi:hypothetical protein
VHARNFDFHTRNCISHACNSDFHPCKRTFRTCKRIFIGSNAMFTGCKGVEGRSEVASYCSKRGSGRFALTFCGALSFWRGKVKRAAPV